jgi:hypothetical protein
VRRAAVLALIAMAGCGDSATEPPGGVPSGPWIGLAAALVSPRAVDAWTIFGGTEPSYFNYPESSRRTPVDAARAKEMAAILADPKSFSDNPKPCEPRPGVKVRYSRVKGEPIWLFFCFDCEELFIYEGSASRGSKEIDPSAKALSALMKRIFPKDSGIQSLK